MLPIKQEWESGFGKKKTDPGLYTSNKGRFLKVYRMNILDNLNSLLFCFHTYGVRRTIDVLDSENQPGSGALRLTGDVWHQNYENKKGSKNYVKYSLNRLLKISFRLRYRAPDPFFCQNRILIPATSNNTLHKTTITNQMFSLLN